MHRRARTVLAGLASAALVVPLVATLAGTSEAVVPAARPPAGPDHPTPKYKDARAPVQERVADLLSRMTPEEKVGQMTQAERGTLDDDPSLITSLKLGSVLSGGGSGPNPPTPGNWADMVDRYQSYALKTRLGIPIIYGVDSVHGHGNVYGATIFPHNIGLGASRDPKLVERAAHVTATETRATGIPWVFAPCLCVTRDARWGRSYESFGEDPKLVTQLTSAVTGLQGAGPADLKRPDRVLATVKHYAGDGNTKYGTGSGDYTIDQGVTVTSRAEFARIDLAPYVDAVKKRKVGSVMPSFSSVDFTDDGVGNPLKMHAHKELISDVLKTKIGFEGFVISDWEGIHQIPGDFPTQVRTAVLAGIDMFMQPYNAADFEATLLAEVKAGRVPVSRIDDAVRRILTAKFRLGLFERPYTDRTHLDDVGSPKHRAVAREAVAKSQVLLKNADNVLPLAKDATIYVAGRNADDKGNQAGGWTLSWQGFSGNEYHVGTSILEGIKQVAPDAKVTYSKDASAPTAGSDVGIVVVGETPYAEGFGDVGGPRWAWDPADNNVPREAKSLDLQPQDQEAIDRTCGAIAKCVVLVVSGRPQVISPARLATIDALVASWLPGSEGAGVADVLFGKRTFTGKLPVTWPATADQEPINIGDADYRPAFRYGFGLTTKPRR